MIELPEEATTTRITTADSSTTSSASQTPVEDPIFDDEETRSFYEDLPDLRAKLPEVLFSNEKEREPESDANKQGGATAAASSTTDGGASTVASTSAPNLATTTTSSAPEASSSSSSSSAEEKRDKIPSKLDLLLQRLPSCVNRDMIDQIATDFCYINSRANRKRLIKALFQVPRTELVLVRRERAAARASMISMWNSLHATVCSCRTIHGWWPCWHRVCPMLEPRLSRCSKTNSMRSFDKRTKPTLRPR